MPRTARATVGGVVYHILNRGNGRLKIFRKPGDYAAFVDLLIDAKQKADIKVMGFCLMPNHWHLVLRPRGDGDLAAYMSWLTNTHVKRYRSHYKQTSGHLYQGRYKSFPVEEDDYFLTLLRYVEANPLPCPFGERGAGVGVVESGLRTEDSRPAVGSLAGATAVSMDIPGEPGHRRHPAAVDSKQPEAGLSAGERKNGRRKWRIAWGLHTRLIPEEGPRKAVEPRKGGCHLFSLPRKAQGKPLSLEKVDVTFSVFSLHLFSL